MQTRAEMLENFRALEAFQRGHMDYRRGKMELIENELPIEEIPMATASDSAIKMMDKFRAHTTPNRAVTREAVFSTKAKVEFIDVPEWGGKVGVRQMSAAEYDAFLQLSEKVKGSNARSMAALVALTVCSSDGNRIFFDSDIDLLERKSLPSLVKVFQFALKVNSLDTEHEELKKTSVTTQS